MAPDVEPKLVKESSHKGILSLVGNRLENTGAHGIPNIKRAETTIRKISWSVLFIAGLGMFVYQSSILINKYYSWPINVNIEVQSVRSIEFPAVTWCNLNPIRKDAPIVKSKLCQIIGGPACNKAANDSNVTMPHISTSNPFPKWHHTTDFKAEDAKQQLLDKVFGFVGAMPYKDRHTTGHELETLLLSCTFNTKQCSPENFTMFYNYRYGNCFTFNSGQDSNLKLNVTKSGHNYGLSLELLIEQHQYIPDLENGAGIRISIHNQSNMPFPEDEGINIAPGRETFIGIHKKFVHRLPSPHGDCERDFGERNIFKTEFNHIHYTQSACLKDCYFREVLERCQCADVIYRYDDSLLACNTTMHGICIESIETSYEDGTLNCSRCQLECSEVVFDKIISSSVWPSRLYKDTLTWKIWDRMNESRSLIEKEDKFVEENLLRVNIYFDQLEYEDIYQDPAYDVTSLLGDLGGIVGLWIGVSVLTMFEFLELVLDVAYLAYHGCRMVGERAAVV